MKKIVFILILLAFVPSACLPQAKTPIPTPTASATPPRAGFLPLARTQKYYAADRVGWNAYGKNYTLGDFALLVGYGVDTAITSMDVNGSAASWRELFAAAQAAGARVVIWPSDWNKPRGSDSVCNYESPFPVTSGGDITRIKALLDVAMEYPNVIGVVTFHEPTSNCKFTTAELAGLRAQILAYTSNKIRVWGYAGNLASTSYWTDTAIGAAMDVMVEWKACAGRTDAPCSSIPNRVAYDRQRIQAAGLEGQVETVFLMQSYMISGDATYGGRLSLEEYKILSCGITQTNAVDGLGYYTWSANWWPDLAEWKDMWSIIPWVYNNCMAPANPRVIPTITAAPQTVTPVSTMFTATPAGGKSPTPSKTVAPVKTSTLTPVKTRTPTPTNTGTGTAETGTPTPYCILLYPGPTPRVDFCP